MNDVVDKGKEVVELKYNEGSIDVAKSPTWALAWIERTKKKFSQALLSYPYTFDNDSITLHNLNFDRKKNK